MRSWRSRARKTAVLLMRMRASVKGMGDVKSARQPLGTRGNFHKKKNMVYDAAALDCERFGEKK